MAGVHLHHCGDVYLGNIQCMLTRADTAYGLLIEAGCTALYAERINITGGNSVLVRDARVPSHPPQWLYFSEVLGDSSHSFGWRFEAGCGFNLVNCWASGCVGGCGVVILPAVDTVALIGSFIMGNAQDGVRLMGGNAQSHLRVEGCTIIGNSSDKSANGAFSGIAIGAGSGGFVVTGNMIYCGPPLQGTGSADWGISIAAGSSDDFIVSGNLLRPNAKGGVRDESSEAKGKVLAMNVA